MTAAHRAARRWRTVDTAAGGLALDFGLYAVSATFAAVTAVTASALAPHRAWGSIAAVGYLVATLLVAAQFLSRRQHPRLAGTTARAAVTGLAWVGTALLPLLVQAGQRAAGRTDRAQEEVVVVEHAGIRLAEHGTPYLGPEAIAALPADERLLGYTPYQPGMALFGLPRAATDAWWTDSRVWFALVTAAALALAVVALRRSTRPVGGRAVGGWAGAPAVLRGVQAATVLPICALTLATGGDDLPVLALCLLALALAAGGRPGPAGMAVGLAGALKLFAWPVALVLIFWGATRRAGLRVAAGALGLPALALLPALLVNWDALVENVFRFPLGHGQVTSPAQSPFPGHLIATALPGGRFVAAALLVAVGAAIAVRLVRRPPRTAVTTALICGYGLLAAIMLMPTTRFGYLLYPIALLSWAPALTTRRAPVPASPRHAPPAGRTPESMSSYRDREDAGRRLAERLTALAGQPDVVVLGLVRGGVPVARVVADRLGAPLDVLVVRKLGLPWAPEVAFGALGPGGVRVLNDQVAARLDPADSSDVQRREQAELDRREARYRSGRPPLDLTGRTALIVDDGLATGATARAAVQVARRLGARRVVVAVPVGAQEAYEMLAAEADEVVCAQHPVDFGAVSAYYDDFHEVDDDEVTEALIATA
ncbi:Predicted phosphoribosyltransferase [Micromonospora matsumotoense]|uniref:Predicted phosphoribosyltransferase n=2 Tax=Micromonospora matsumotoense TaxID=121616 RepID=A0A1C4ZU91_9ACTN|nr:Predicted phosphoribosyltransferase [Micromonospora matsumotoense]